MKVIVCEICESKDFVKKDGMYICQQCGTKFTVEEVKKLMVDDPNSDVRADSSVSVTNTESDCITTPTEPSNKKSNKKVVILVSVIVGVVVLLAVGTFVGLNIFSKSNNQESQTKNNSTNSTNINSIIDEKDTTEPEIQATPLSLTESLHLDYAFMNFWAFEVSDGYNFEHTDDSSGISITKKSSIDCPSGMKLVCLKGVFQNLTNGEIYPSNNPTNAVMTINGTNYNTQMECFDTYFAEPILSVAAQREVEYFLYAEVPEKVANSIESCEVKLGFVKDLNPSVFVSSDSDFDHLYILYAKPEKK